MTIQKLSDFDLDELIFLDANTFAYHFTGHPRWGDACSGFLARVEAGSVRAATSNVVEHEVMYALQMDRGEKLLGTHIRSRVHERIAADSAFARECWLAAKAMSDFMDVLRANGLVVVDVVSSQARSVLEVGSQCQLVVRDATLAFACRSAEARHLASNDADFDRVPFLTRWAP